MQTSGKTLEELDYVFSEEGFIPGQKPFATDTLQPNSKEDVSGDCRQVEKQI